jgi:hypothetical protein
VTAPVCAAAGTEAAALATERDQVFGVAAVAAYPEKAVFETAASEVVLELALDIARQCRALCRHSRHESRIVFFNKLIKERSLRAVAHIVSRTLARTGFPASWQRQHGRILASLY